MKLPTATAEVAKRAMLCAANKSRASRLASPPSQTARTVFDGPGCARCRSTIATTCSAMSVLEASAVGQFMIRTASDPARPAEPRARGRSGRTGVADDVDGVAVRPGRRQHGVERRSSRVGDGRERPFEVAKPVNGHHTGAPAVGQDCEPVACEARLDRTHSEVSGTTPRKHVAKRERAEIDKESRLGF